MLKILCLPCAGASATMYFRWKQFVPMGIQIVPMELAGRGVRLSEPHINNFETMLDDLILRYEHELQGNYVLFGHSMGGMLAHGIANRLSMINNRYLKVSKPKAIFVSACSPVRSMLAETTKQAKQNKQAKLSDQEIIKILKQMNGTPEQLFQFPDLLSMVINNMRADIEVCQSAHIKNQHIAFSHPIHVLCGREDKLQLSDLKIWQSLTDQSCTTDFFEGDHFYLQPSQSETELLSKIFEYAKAYQ